MVSVTSEALASRSFQGPTTRSARPDPASQAGNDGFAALVAWQGGGHGAFPRTPCVTDAVRHFLIDGQIPASRVACPA